MSRTSEVEAAIIRAYNNDGATATWNARTLAAEVERLERLLARLGAAEARLKRLESAQGDWVPGLKCTKCHGTGESEDVHSCPACAGTGDVWMSWKQRAEAAEARAKELEMDVAALEAWKASALDVEKQWDAQKVGKLLGLPLGTQIHAGIEPAVTRLLERDARLRAALEDIGTLAHCISKAGPLNTPDLATAWHKFDLISVKATQALADTKGTT